MWYLIAQLLVPYLNPEDLIHLRHMNHDTLSAITIDTILHKRKQMVEPEVHSIPTTTLKKLFQLYPCIVCGKWIQHNTIVVDYLRNRRGYIYEKPIPVCRKHEENVTFGVHRKYIEKHNYQCQNCKTNRTTSERCQKCHVKEIKTKITERLAYVDAQVKRKLSDRFRN